MMLEKKKRILIAHYYQPYPPRDGAARRCIDMVKAFQLLGYDVTLFTSDLVHPFSLSAEAIKKAKDELNIQLVVYKSAADERQYIQSKSFKWNAYVTPGLIHYFSLLHKSLQPEIVLVNYVFWAELAIEKQFKNCMRIIDAIDVLSLNQKMAAITVSYLNKGEVSNNSQYSIEGANGEVLEEDFFLRFDLAADQEEYDKYDQFDLTVAISANETALIKENTKSTKCVYLPFFFDVGKDKKIYTGPPIFAIGANQFNYQGYLYFVKKVLPKVLKERPDFVLHVVGDGCKHLEPTKGIALLGFVSDLNELYLKSGFAICPLIGATGQQLKVMEAMAKGLPVIALRNVAERCPIIQQL